MVITQQIKTRNMNSWRPTAFKSKRGADAWNVPALVRRPAVSLEMLIWKYKWRKMRANGCCGVWAFWTMEWKMWERWMKRSEISLSASLNRQFHNCSKQVPSQSDWWVSSLKAEGSRCSWELLLSLWPFCPFSLLSPDMKFSCNFEFRNKWTPMAMVLLFQWWPSSLYYDQHRPLASTALLCCWSRGCQNRCCRHS